MLVNIPRLRFTDLLFLNPQKPESKWHEHSEAVDSNLPETFAVNGAALHVTTDIRPFGATTCDTAQ